MSSSSVNVFCQVGFPEKKDPENVYFHKIEGSMYGGYIAMEDGEDILSPFTVEDLVGGNIDFDLLPSELHELIGQIAKQTYDAIERMNPEYVRVLNPAEIEVSFSLMEDDDDGVEDEGRLMN